MLRVILMLRVKESVSLWLVLLSGVNALALLQNDFES